MISAKEANEKSLINKNNYLDCYVEQKILEASSLGKFEAILDDPFFALNYNQYMSPAALKYCNDLRELGYNWLIKYINPDYDHFNSIIDYKKYRVVISW